MKGKVTKWISPKSYGFITGEDGNQYFTHKSEVQNVKDLRKGSIVTFDVREEEGNPRAINVFKVGHGVNHPFANDLGSILESFEDGSYTDEIIKNSITKKLARMQRYFYEVEDVEWCNNVIERFSK